MTSTRLAAAALLLPFTLGACTTRPADEQGASASSGSIVRSGCRQGQCSWLHVLRVEGIESRPEGRLIRIVARAGTSTYPHGTSPREPSRRAIRWETDDRIAYAFCSTRRPAYAFSDGSGGLVVHFLDPFDLAGYQLASAALYMRFCHARDEVPEPDVLRSLGYVPGTRNEQIETTDAGVLSRF